MRGNAREKFTYDGVKPSVTSTADPAAGADPAAVTVPTGKVWRVLAMRCQTVTSADVANRYPVFYITCDGTIEVYRAGTTTAITASLTTDIACGQEYVGRIGNRLTVGFRPLELPAGATINFALAGIQAADNSTALTVMYQEVDA